MKLFFHKFFHWEYWSFGIIYFPIVFVHIFYALKSRNLFFFNACNPGIKNGGFMGEGKKEIYDSINPKYYPKTELILENASFETVGAILKQSGIQFPFIAKPDKGFGGQAVKKINNLEELTIYHRKANFDYLLQALIPYANEIGVFYIRFPNEQKGRITGLNGKQHATVEGDGKSTIEQLIKKNPRYEMLIEEIRKEIGDRFDEVIEQGVKVTLSPYGNLHRGTKMVDLTHLISDKLNEAFDKICQEIPEFYFGRFDIMCDSLADLEQGENFSIVELNGASSGPTHIYDPKHSIFFGWKELIKYTGYMYQISVQNHKRGFPYLSFKEGVREYKLDAAQRRKIANF